MRPPNTTHRLYGRGQRLTDAEIVQLYADLKDAEIVGMKAGVSSTTVLNRVRAAGGEVHPPGHTRARPKVQLRITQEEVCRQYLAGTSGPRLAELAGCSVRHVYTILEAAGVRRRLPGEVARETSRERARAARARRGS